MTASSGAGYSAKSNSAEAGEEAARQALAKLGAAPIHLCFLFFTAKQDAKLVHEGVRRVIGKEPQIFGGSSVGVVTKEKLSYGGFEVGVALISAPGAKFDIFSQAGLGRGDEISVGRGLGAQIEKHGAAADSGLILLYDSVRGQPSAPLNMATPLLAGLRERLGSSMPTTAGAGLMGDMEFKGSNQIFNDQIDSQTALALLTSGDVRLDTMIIHGCKPSGSYHRITKTDGPVVLEIDNQPATEVVAGMLGPNSEKSWKDYPLFITLGVNKGKKFEDFNEDMYANRLCMAVDEARQGLIMFEPDLKAGDEVQLMSRDTNFDYIRTRAESLFNKLENRRPFFALYIDCIGRAGAFCGLDREEAVEIQQVVGERIPLLGIYTGVEIAKVGNDLQALDWTGVLCVFSTR